MKRSLFLETLKKHRLAMVSGLLAMSLLFPISLTHSGPIQGAEAEEAEEAEDATEEGEPVEGKGYEAMMSEGGRTLSINMETTEIRITDDQTGSEWFSNPQDREQDAIANGANKALLSSQITVSYFTGTGQEIIKNNFFDATRLGQFEIEKVGDEVRVSYIIGEAPKDYIHPLAMEKEKFDAFFDTLDKKAQKLLKRRYSLQDPAKLKGEKRDEMLAQFPEIANKPFYVLRDGIKDYILEDISSAFEEGGYTVEQKAEDEAEAGLEQVTQEVLNVTVNIYYSLKDGDLMVRVPMKEIEFDPSFPVTEISLMGMFGAVGSEDEGYLFIPDGSGALIQANNGKLSTNHYLAHVYGVDRATRQTVQVGTPEQVTLPVFGAVSGEQAFLGIIEEGSSLASIKADISGRSNSYNTVNPIFSVLTQDIVDLREIAGNNVIMAYQQAVYEGDIRIRYRLLEGERAHYSGMAAEYREYLEAQGAFERLQGERFPLQLEVLAAIDRNRPILGIPANRIQELTSITETRELITQLNEAGIKDLDLRLSGWANGGLKQGYAKSVKPLGDIGSRKQLEELQSALTELGYGFYPDATFSYIYRNTWFDGFRPSAHASRYLDREVVEYTKIQPSTMIPSQTNPFWLLSPKVGTRYLTSFGEEIREAYDSGLSIRDLGRDLGSDYLRQDEINREKAMHMWTQSLDTLKEAGQPMMFEYGNAYTLPYADVILDTPSKSSEYQITDQSIPFLQMVLHGYVDYSLEAANLSGDWEGILLKSLEYGAVPRFTVMDERGSILKNTNYSDYFSVDVDLWQDHIIEAYQKLEPVLGPLRTETIERHEQLAEGVSQITYSNGQVLTVNTSLDAYSDDGMTVPAMDFIVEKGGAQ